MSTTEFGKILEYAQKLGADEAEVYFLDKQLITVRMTGGQVLESKGIHDRGVGIRVVRDKAIGMAVTNDLTQESLEKTTKNALRIAKIRGPAKHWKSLPKPKKAESVPKIFDRKVAEMDLGETVNLAIRMLDMAKGFSRKIVDVSGSLNVFTDNVHIMNTHGVDVSQISTSILGSITTEAEKGGSHSSGVGFQGSCSLKGFNPENVGEESADMAVRSLGAQKLKAGDYSLILEPFALAEVTSHVFAGAVISKRYQDKVSCFQGKLGEVVSDKRLSIYDDPTMAGYLGATSFDDEGVPTRRLPLIEKGVFKNLLYDTFYASKDHVASTGNAKRTENLPGRSYTSIPFPEPHNFVVDRGKQSKDELIEDTRRGILVGRIWYTYALHPERGDFSTTTRSGAFLVRNGEIKKPILPMRIYDNLLRCLKDLGGIANDVKQVTPWFGYYLVAPTVRFDRVKATPV